MSEAVEGSPRSDRIYAAFRARSCDGAPDHVTATPMNGLRVYTTYLTGSLSKFSEALVDYLFWFRDRTGGRLWTRFFKVLRISSRRRCIQHAGLTAGLSAFSPGQSAEWSRSTA